MNKRKKNIALIGISVVNLIITYIIYTKLKSPVPIKLWTNGDAISKLAKKDYLLILPVISVLISCIQVLYRTKTIDKPVTTVKRVEDGLFAFLDGSIMFINWILLYISYEFTMTTNPNVKIPVVFVLMGILGLALAGVYSTFPINKIGSRVGLRTKETMSSNEVWRIANRFNALTGFISSVCIVLFSIYSMIFEFNLILFIVLLFVCAMLMGYVPVLYARKVGRELGEKIVE